MVLLAFLFVMNGTAIILRNASSGAGQEIGSFDMRTAMPGQMPPPMLSPPTPRTAPAQDGRAQRSTSITVRSTRSKECRCRHSGAFGDGVHRPVGLRQVDLPALHQPHERHHLDRRASRARSRSTITISTIKSLDVVQLRARVGMVFQKPNPFPKSIYENVAYGPRIHGLAQVEGRTRRNRRPPACKACRCSTKR